MENPLKSFDPKEKVGSLAKRVSDADPVGVAKSVVKRAGESRAVEAAKGVVDSAGEQVSNVDPVELIREIIAYAMQVPGVAVDRDEWLTGELSRYCSADIVQRAVDTSPFEAGVDADVVNKIADKAIKFETSKAAGLSFLSGIPGGLALIGTIPADLTQYYAHIIRIEQKLAYVYGWSSFLEPGDVVDDETMGKLAMLMGVAEGIGAAGSTLTKFAVNTAQKGVQKTIEKQALTKTFFYGPIKGIMRVLGVKVTKQSFSKAVSKVVPVAGGVISGGMTLATFSAAGKRLKTHLSALPQAGAPLVQEGLDDEMSLEEIEAALEAEYEAIVEEAGADEGDAE